MMMSLDSGSPTPGTGSATCLLDSPPGRLRSGSGRSDARPSWLRATNRMNPLRPPRTLVPSTPPRALDLPPSSPPWRTSPYSGHDDDHENYEDRSGYADGYEDFEMPLNDLPRPLGRTRPPTPHPSSSTLNGPGTLNRDDRDDDTLPDPDEDDGIEVARSRASPPWSPDNPFLVLPRRAPRTFLNGGDSSPLLPPDAVSSPPRLPPSTMPGPPPIPGIPRTRQYPKDGEWREIKALIDRVRRPSSHSRSPPVDRWGFDRIRGMTMGHEPYQYNGNPSSDDRRLRRLVPRSLSPYEFSATPSPDSESASDQERHMYAPSPQVPARIPSPAPLNRRPVSAWRGGALYNAWLTDRRWPAPQNWENNDSDDENGESGDDGADRLRIKRRAGASGASSAERELSPEHLAAREERVRHFNDIEANYRLHVERS